MEKKSIFLLVSATLLSGISVYFVLSYLLIGMEFVIPICISMALLSLGLTRYYSALHEKVIDNRHHSRNFVSNSQYSSTDDQKNIQEWVSKVLFLFFYSGLLVVCAFLSTPRLDVVYTSWNLFNPSHILELLAGILLCFILPGYAVLTIVIKNYRMKPLLSLLLAYFISMLITGLTVYFSAILFDSNIYQDKSILLLVYLAIIIAYIVRYRLYGINLPHFDLQKVRHSIISAPRNMWTTVKSNLSEGIVFASLSLLVIISTYYLYGGVTIGDQWYHQNRAILFMYGDFKDSIITDGDQNYTPLLSALLAGLTSISGVPLANAYASIALLNMTAVLAFYHLCRTWLPLNLKKASLFASSLLVIASGLGWMYVLYLAGTDPLDSPANSISYFVQEKIRESDIRLSSNFIIAAFPDFNTSLTLVSLPAGFILLSLIKIELSNKIRHLLIVLLVTLLGTLFHDEFYFFIIVSCLLMVAYNTRKKTNVFFGLLVALALLYVIDSFLPVNYFTSNRIFGVSVIELSIIFIIVTLCLYLLRQNWDTYFLRIWVRRLPPVSKRTKIQLKTSYISKVLFVSIVAYLIALCFLVWIQLPANYIDAHTQNYNTPWYLYPFRMGIVGMFGIAFVLSCLFRRYERAVFVFGIIIIIALFAGPYYNEHRFSKYAMVGMIVFASMMIFKLLNFTKIKSPILNGILVASIVITASLSTLMYIGYNALVIQTQDYSHALGRRNFPSATEMTVLDDMRSKIQDVSSNNNIATFSNEYNFRKGDIISKLHAFSGLPLKKSIQTQYVLNASSPDSFFHLLDLSSTGYIMIPSNSTNQFTLSDPTRFAITNFPVLSKNDNYLVLKVPSLLGPSINSQKQVGIIRDLHDPLSSMIFDEKTLQLSNLTFDFEKDTNQLVKVDKSHEAQIATLFGNKKNGGKTLWSNELDDNGTNYMELQLRILNETKDGKGVSGLKWKEGDRIYFVSLSSKGLQLREQTTNVDKSLLLAQNSQIVIYPGMWHSVRVVTFNDSITVYVDNSLSIKIPKHLQKDSLPVRSIGINSENGVVEFRPVKIGKIQALEEDIRINEYRYYYYPLTSLAVSGVAYSSYTSNDYSVFSNSEIILPLDSQELTSELFNNLLNYTTSGGTLVVINPGDKLDGKFAKLLNLESTNNKTREFVRIGSHGKNGLSLNVSGIVHEFSFKPISNVKVLASYRNINNTDIAPFVIEKTHGKGRIIYVNSFGYFDAIHANPKKNFLSLVKFGDVFQLDHLRDKVIENKTTSPPIKRFIGDVTVGGKMTLYGSSFSLEDSLFNSSNYYVKKVSILDRYGNLKNQYENLTIADIKPFGKYEHLINFTDKISLPSANSKIDYMEVSIPNEFNMTIKLHGDDDSHFTIITNNSKFANTIQIGNESKIELYGIRAEFPIFKNIPVLLKSPELLVNGNVLFDRTNFYGQEIDDYIPLNASGNIQIKFDLVDDFKSQSRQGSKIDYLSYIGFLDIEGKRNQIKQQIDLPGQISFDIEKRGMGVPISNILGSLINFIVVIAIILSSIIVVLLHKSHIHNHNSLDK